MRSHRSSAKPWARWLHLGCGVPVEHVAIVLDPLTPADIASLTSFKPVLLTTAEAKCWAGSARPARRSRT